MSEASIEICKPQEPLELLARSGRGPSATVLTLTGSGESCSCPLMNPIKAMEEIWKSDFSPLMKSLFSNRCWRTTVGEHTVHVTPLSHRKWGCNRGRLRRTYLVCHKGHNLPETGTSGMLVRPKGIARYSKCILSFAKVELRNDLSSVGWTKCHIAAGIMGAFS